MFLAVVFLTEEAAATEKEINYIDSRLRELRTKKADLQNNCDNILNAKDNKHNSGEHGECPKPSATFFMLESCN